MQHIIPLEGRSIIEVTGDDARPFLQGLVTVDMNTLSAANPRYGALLSPQGKFLHDFFLIADGERILLDTESARAAELMKRLKLYRLKAKVEMVVLTDWAVVASATAVEPGIAIPDPRLPALGWRIYGPRNALQANAPFAEYETLRLAHGVPDGSRDMIVDRTLILECGFEELRGVDFNKGCYVGQEVTARSKFRGQLRKGLYIVKSEKALPQAGTPVLQNEKNVGEIRSSCQGLGLAILQAEAVENGGKLLADGMVIATQCPAWRKAESAGETAS